MKMDKDEIYVMARRYLVDNYSADTHFALEHDVITSFIAGYNAHQSPPPPKEEKSIGDFIKWLKTDRLFFVDEVRNWLRQYDKEEISFSKFVELFNLKVFNEYGEPEGKEAVEFADWIAKKDIMNYGLYGNESWGFSLQGKRYTTEQLYKIWKEQNENISNKDTDPFGPGITNYL